MIEITESAVRQLRTLVGAVAEKGLRIGIAKGGCSGLQYEMTLGAARPGDAIIERDGVKFFVDEESAHLLRGSTLDYRDALTGAGFQGIRTSLQVFVAAINVAINFPLITRYSWRVRVWDGQGRAGGDRAVRFRLADAVAGFPPLMLVGKAQDGAAARGAGHEALLDEVGLVDLLDGAAVLAAGGGDGLDADRAAVELLDDDAQDAAAHAVEAQLVDLDDVGSDARRQGEPAESGGLKEQNRETRESRDLPVALPLGEVGVGALKSAAPVEKSRFGLHT